MISVLMPVKNAAPYLKECIDSLLGQTAMDWELIAVNDHSTDQSNEILQKYALLDNRISVFQNKGNGIIDALSTAYSMSKGTSITRMDADDVMLPEKLETLSSLLRDNPNAIITSKVKYISSNGVNDGYRKYEGWLNALTETNSHYNEIYKECVLPSPNWMMTRKSVEDLGGFRQLEYPEDYDLCFKGFQLKKVILGSKKVLHLWRDYPERTSRNDPNYADNRFTAIKVKYFDLCSRRDEDELYLWGAGNRGKLIAKELIKRKISFKWITDNVKKMGLDIYGVKLQSSSDLRDNNGTQVIVAVASPADQSSIKENLGNVEAFWFC